MISNFSINGFLSDPVGRRLPDGLVRARIKTPFAATVKTRSNRRLHRVEAAYSYKRDGRLTLAAHYVCGESSATVVPVASVDHWGLCERCDEVTTYGETPWQVYVHHAADGSPLYVGMTANLTMRRRHHAKGSPWWSEVAEIRVASRHAAKRDALDAEARLIHDLSPAHNIRHNNRSAA